MTPGCVCWGNVRHPQGVLPLPPGRLIILLDPVTRAALKNVLIDPKPLTLRELHFFHLSVFMCYYENF